MPHELFSPTENELIKLLDKRVMKIGDLTEEFYSNYPVKPLNFQNIVSGAILRINKKCKYHELNWHIQGFGLGRLGKTIWKEKLK